MGAWLSLVTPVAAQPNTPRPAATCASAAGLAFICGLDNVEDLVVAPGGRWLVGSSLKARGAGLYVIDTRTRAARPARITIARAPGAGPFGDCAPPDLSALRTHGLAIRPGRGDIHTLYVVNHGERESVEVFRLDMGGAWPQARWTGCLMLPPAMNANAVAPLPGGGLVITKFRDAADTEGLVHMLQGELTGLVMSWTPDQGLREVLNSRMAGANGVLVTPDGKTLFVSDYGGKAVRRIALDGKTPPVSVETSYRPDNLRWAADGRILVTGQFFELSNRGAGHDWGVDALDPATMTLSEVAREKAEPNFADGTVAVQAAGALWFGTFRGDRVGLRTIQRATEACRSRREAGVKRMPRASDGFTGSPADDRQDSKSYVSLTNCWGGND